MKKVYIIHGWEGSPEHGWLYWLQNELRTLDIEAVGLFMPHPEIPTIEDWVQALKDQIMFDSETYIVAHSVGFQATIRCLQTLENIQIGGLLSVAGRFHLENLKDEDLLIARPWLETIIDAEKAKEHCKQFVALLSDNDPWVPVSDAEEFIQKLDAEVIIEHEMDHMYWLDPQRGYPLVKDIVLEMMDVATSYQLPATSSDDGSDIESISNQDLQGPGLHSEEHAALSTQHAANAITIRVLDRDGSDMGSFEASKYEPILETAEKNNIDIGYSCRSGACFSCACHVKQGFEHIDLGKFGYPLVDVDEQDALTCIAGIMDDAWDGKAKEIVIKRF